MRGVYIVFVLALLDCSSAAHSQIVSSSYSCTAEFVGGLAYNKNHKHWESTTFNPREKFVLAIKVVGTRTQGLERIDELIVTITQPGSSSTATCSNSQGGPHNTASGRDGIIQCNAVATDYTFNTRNNRFLSVYAIGYISGRDDNDNTPAVTGGTCTKIN